MGSRRSVLKVRVGEPHTARLARTWSFPALTCTRLILGSIGGQVRKHAGRVVEGVSSWVEVSSSSLSSRYVSAIVQSQTQVGSRKLIVELVLDLEDLVYY